MKRVLLFLTLIPILAFSQSKKEKKAMEAQEKADRLLIDNISSQAAGISANMSDKASLVNFISDQFSKAGLVPRGNNGYLQQLTIDDGLQVDTSTYLRVNGSELILNKQFFPLEYSASKNVTGMPAMALRERGVPWFKDVKEWMNDSTALQTNINSAIIDEATKAAAKGATALFVYNSTANGDGIFFNNKNKTAAAPIPVVYIMNDGYQKFFSDNSQMLDIEMNVLLNHHSRNLTNIVGYVDNNAATTVAASSSINHTQSGFNKLDVSGTATLLQLANVVQQSTAKHNNYIFLVTIGENPQQAGTKFWLETASVPTINYSINLENVSAFDANNRLMISGAQTCDEWNKLFTAIDNKAVNADLSLGDVKSGTIGTFYQKQIPALSFATMPANAQQNEVAAQDFKSELQTLKFVSQLINLADGKGQLAFAKVEDAATPTTEATTITTTTTTSVRYVAPTSNLVKTAVSLGVIPEKGNDGTGLKISGVSSKKLAAKLGLQPNDVLTYLGNFKITDINTYLSALSNFKPGDKTVLGIKRGKEDKEFAVEF